MTTMKLSTRDITQMGMFTALTAIGAFVSIPVGPVSITLQSFFVLLSGIILGSKKAMYSQIAYLLLGLTGLAGCIQTELWIPDRLYRSCLLSGKNYGGKGKNH